MANLIGHEDYEARLEVCRGCHYWSGWDGRCKGCGCIMNIKARWAGAVCPLRQWPPLAETYREHMR